VRRFDAAGKKRWTKVDDGRRERDREGEWRRVAVKRVGGEESEWRMRLR